MDSSRIQLAAVDGNVALSDVQEHNEVDHWEPHKEHPFILEQAAKIFMPAFNGQDHRLLADIEASPTDESGDAGEARSISATTNSSLVQIAKRQLAGRAQESSEFDCKVCRWTVRYLLDACCEYDDTTQKVRCDPHSDRCEQTATLGKMAENVKDKSLGNQMMRECFDGWHYGSVNRPCLVTDRWTSLRRIWGDLSQLGSILSMLQRTYNAMDNLSCKMGFVKMGNPMSVLLQQSTFDEICYEMVTETFNCWTRPKLPKGLTKIANTLNIRRQRNKFCDSFGYTKKRGGWGVTKMLNSLDTPWKTWHACPKPLRAGESPPPFAKEEEAVQTAATQEADAEALPSSSFAAPCGPDGRCPPDAQEEVVEDASPLGFPEAELQWTHDDLVTGVPGRWHVALDDLYINSGLTKVLDENDIFLHEDLASALAQKDETGRSMSSKLLNEELLIFLYERAHNGNPERWWFENVPSQTKDMLEAVYNEDKWFFGAGKIGGSLQQMQKIGWSSGALANAGGTGFLYADKEDRETVRHKIEHYQNDYHCSLAGIAMEPPCERGMSEAQCTDIAVNHYKSYNQFFYRKLRPGTRRFLCYSQNAAECAQVDSDKRTSQTLISPADSRVVVFPTFTPHNMNLWVKGEVFKLRNIVELPEQTYKYYDDGIVLIFRLAPQDYHRFHFPIDGTIKDFKHYPGNYYSVNPIAVADEGHYAKGGRNTTDQASTSTPVFTTNKRMHVLIDSGEENFGCALFISVGATNVASVIHTSYVGQKVVRGMEHGYMAFGGSTVIAVLRKDVLDLDEDLTRMSAIPVETMLRMGDHVGDRKPRGPKSLDYSAISPCR